jgi:hypothetical protein
VTGGGPDTTADLTSPVTASLVNAITGQPIAGFDPIPAGATITLSTLPTQQLSIRANVPSTVASVKFLLDGTYAHVESWLPFSFCGDPGPGGDLYVPCTQLNALGNHTLTITPYSGSGATGTAGTPLSLSFDVQQDASRAGSVAHLSLMSAVTQTPIAGFDPIPNGATIDLSKLPTDQLFIRATPSTKVASVVFKLDSTYSHTENVAPYDLCGDNTACPQLAAGFHTLQAIPYGTDGVAGAPIEIAFTIQSTPSAAHSVALAFTASTTPNVTYTIRRGTTSGGPYTTVASSLSAASFTDSTVLSGATYYYVATAVSAAGLESVFSNQATAVIP